MSSCPNENKIVAFAQGSLGEAAVGAIERHLDHCRDCATVLCDAAAALDVVVPDDEQDTPVLTSPSKEVLPQHGQLLPQGTCLGRYVVLDLLGTGGLGCVYAAYDPELDRRVAVKILQPRAEIALAERAQPMLKREAQALAKLAHPNVVPVHDVGTIEDRVFIAMELVRGPTLREWLKQERRTWQQVRDVFVQAGRGLLAAHRAGLVHRDFKPTNVLLAEDDRPQVVDFGLARAVSQVVPPSNSAGSTPATPVSSNQDLTGTGSVVGTPAYMAPEQLRGGAVDARADQFAFCVTMYEALYGQRPFQAQGLKALEQLVTSGHIPDPPPGRSVPAWLRRAITVGLRPDPARRYASMAELLRAIAADLHSKRRQWLALAAAVACTAVVTVLMTLWVQPQPTPRQVESVQEMASQARAAAQRARYLYPPVDAPESPTALSIVYQLEQLDGSAQELGVERAEELRREFSTALAHLGDEYWERPGGATFASDYYAAAVIFWPANEHAKSRLYLTLPQLAHLTQKAQTRDFTRPELVAAEVLAALAEPDLQLRRAKVERLTERSDELPATIEGRLGELVGIAAKPVRPPAARPASALPAPHIDSRFRPNRARLGCASRGAQIAVGPRGHASSSPTIGPDRGPCRRCGRSTPRGRCPIARASERGNRSLSSGVAARPQYCGGSSWPCRGSFSARQRQQGHSPWGHRGSVVAQVRAISLQIGGCISQGRPLRPGARTVPARQTVGARQGVQASH
ncbi:MAG: serine/threonine protein kinase [Nannocystaceae bacterium]|nr:serine/threonine protein kinase [Nannocystaceae bacterium]